VKALQKSGNDRPVIAVDPGRAKCGLAVVFSDGKVIHRNIVPARMIGETVSVLSNEFKTRTVVLGTGTASQEILREILAFVDSVNITQIPEANTTLQARALYWQDNPPGYLLRLIPVGMRIPPRPIDDYAAVLIALRFFEKDHQDGDAITKP